MKSIITLKVRYSETDRMGIVYHANYYPWFELGRIDLMEKVGFSYAGMEDNGLMMPLSETHCKYIRPCTFADEVTVETVLVSVSAARCRFEYKVFKDGVLLAEGATVHAFVNSDLKVINIKKYFPRMWEAMNSVKEEKTC